MADAPPRPLFWLARVARMDTLGMTNGCWWNVVRARDFDVDASHVPRLLLAQLVAAASTVGSMLPKASARIDARALPVVFIIGHWRSGTTYLHQLLAADRTRFATLDAATATFPHLQGTALRWPVLRALGLHRDYPRLFDNVIIGPGAPMELEYAIMNLIGGSEYLCWTFPRAKWALLDYLRDDPRRLPQAHHVAWREAVVEVTARLAAPGMMVLHKNPPSTACVAELAALFPRARFVFLSRNPAQVYRSTLKTMRALNAVGRLQDGGEDDLTEYVVARYLRLHRAYLAQRGQLDPQRLVEATFAELEQDPLGLVARIHERFGWSFDPGPIQAQLRRTAGYRKNEHPSLDEPTLARLRQAWGEVLGPLGLSL